MSRPIRAEQRFSHDHASQITSSLGVEVLDQLDRELVLGRDDFDDAPRQELPELLRIRLRDCMQKMGISGRKRAAVLEVFGLGGDIVH